MDGHKYTGAPIEKIPPGREYFLRIPLKTPSLSADQIQDVPVGEFPL